MCPRRARSCDAGCSGLAASFDGLILELHNESGVPNHGSVGYVGLFCPHAPSESYLLIEWGPA
jgi:hypothetical protein